MTNQLNQAITGMQCLKCGRTYPIGDYFFGCPDCLAEGVNSAMTFIYQGKQEIEEGERSFLRFKQMLPYTLSESLGEGDTPVIRLKGLEKSLGIKAVYGKNEFQNPTGSHKDRMNPFIIARAREMGYHAVTCASSGNEAASLAAYAALSDMDCINVSTQSIPLHWKQASDACGARLVLTETSPERLRYQRDNMGKEWYPATNLCDIPTSSSAYGIQGYKSISFELYERFGEQLPDFILIPTCRGDLLYGIYEGFADLKRNDYISAIPHLVACEPNPRLELVLENGLSHAEKFVGNTSQTSSIGGNTTTYQAEYALRKSDGFAVSVSQEEAVASVKEMASFGLYLETSSSIALPCLKKAIAMGRIKEDDRVVLILTSNGYKNTCLSFQ